MYLDKYGSHTTGDELNQAAPNLPTVLCGRGLPRPVHGHPRRLHRQRRAAVDAQRPALLADRAAVGGQRLHDDLRRLPACSAGAPPTCSAAGGCSSPAQRCSRSHVAGLRARVLARPAHRRARTPGHRRRGDLAGDAAIITTSLARGRGAQPRRSACGRAIGGLGASSGALLGGLLTQLFGWPAIFAINVPLGAVVVMLGARVLVEAGVARTSSVISTSPAPCS